ncbi:MAG: radical SAM protein [Syntrophobacteraceae bacterium]
MELPCRDRGDELLGAGEMIALRLRLRKTAAMHDLSTVIVSAFDHRTRMLPFVFLDKRIAPAGVRALGSAMADIGCHKTRIVLQQWNRNFKPSHMRLDGRVPDILMVSSMHFSSSRCEALIRDACRMDPSRRPLIIAGGPKMFFAPWSVFSANVNDPWGADIAVTGEEYVLLSLLEVLLSVRAGNEPIRSAFERARDSGALDGIPGLVYARTDAKGVPVELVDTGIQRLLGELDELPSPILGYRLLEPPSELTTLASKAIAADRVRKYTRIASIVMTQGCRFSCPFCPMPAYNQRQFRAKSGERIAEEMDQIYDQYGIHIFFGTDDNFFADRQRALEIAETLARKVDAGSRNACKVRWGTEATVHDTLKFKDQLPLVRKAGLWALFLGIEDMSGNLVKKGQSADRTAEVLSLLRQSGIFPIPMLMHHDAQPLFSVRAKHGLINQLHSLRKAGAIHMHVLMLYPAPGSKTYEEDFTSGIAFESVNGFPVEPSMHDGMHVVASRHPHPWVKQLNILAAYVYFFNPLRFIWALFRSKSRIPLADQKTWPPPGSIDDLSRRQEFVRRWKRKLGAHLADAAVQLIGMSGLFTTIRRMIGWIFRLMQGNIKQCTKAPASPIPMRGVDGGPASHAPPGTPLSPLRQAPVMTEESPG